MGAFPAKMSIVEKLFALTFAMIAVGVRAAITEISSSDGYVNINISFPHRRRFFSSFKFSLFYSR